MSRIDYERAVLSLIRPLTALLLAALLLTAGYALFHYDKFDNFQAAVCLIGGAVLVLGFCSCLILYFKHLHELEKF